MVVAPIAAVLGIFLSVGVSGSGKTYGMKGAVFGAARHMQVLVVDRMAEWSSVPRKLGLNHRGFARVEDAIAWLQSQGRRPALAIVRGAGDVALEFDKACDWATQGDEPRGVACSEVHRACPNHVPLQSHVEVAVTQWRHKRVALFVDTQRLPLLAPTVREQSTSGLRIYAVFGPRDLAVIKQTWGDEVEAAVRECARRFVEGGGAGGTGAGWFVRPNVPPYRLERGA